MQKWEYLQKPEFVPPLDPGFRPAVLANRFFLNDVYDSGQSVPLIFGLERLNGAFSRFETAVFKNDHPQAAQNLFYAERLLKFLLWQRGGWKIYVGGPSSIGEHLQLLYTEGGAREFDSNFMGRIYSKPFTVVSCTPEEVPAESEIEKHLGRHMEGNRIGFDLGASDLKVSAVVDGEAIFSTEIEWQPSDQSDPEYHKNHIQEALNLAASKMPSLDAIGGSSAGVYINNRPMAASLFRSVPKDKYHQAQNIFLEIQEKMGVPLEIVNDGEVTALAGSMSLEDNGVLGIAMGSSEAGGYTTTGGSITDWLNELAFCPLDFQPDAAVDEWSLDEGVGAIYFSQQSVFRLAKEINLVIPEDLTNAQKLKFVQKHLESGAPEAQKIWETIGIYLGYTIAHYADYYDIKHVLILGRCTSGSGGTIILDNARKVLEGEFPELTRKINIQLPDEKSRRVGQSIAAASLPELDK